VIKLAIFDLDHTLLNGDSDVLWCDFLLQRGVLERAAFEPRSREMERGYKAGTVSTADFCGFYIGTLAGRTRDEWRALRADYFRQEIAPRIPQAAKDLVKQHARMGDQLLMSTATNRYLTELTAAYLGFEELLATECEFDLQDRFTGKPAGTLNMREGKVTRLQAWLAQRGLESGQYKSTMYSDSINDLPMMLAADHAVCVNPDAQLAEKARQRGWATLNLHTP
jgi:HAD superfamily hydrolase (TIGR01490 family)